MRLSILFLISFLSAVSAAGQNRKLTISVIDADSKHPLAARIYLHDKQGKAYFVESAESSGTAFQYQKQNWTNKDSREEHTTVSAHRSVAELPSGTYRLEVERGKSWFPAEEQVVIGSDDVAIEVPLKRWINMSERGWYSGDMHLHRGIDELKNVIIAENLNIVFPLTNWVTLSDTPPSAGDKNLDATLPSGPVRVGPDHVIWPRSTEYEIFKVGETRHTLGALFVLGHWDALAQTVPPWKGVVDAAMAEDPDILFDMDKLAWPFAMTLPVITPGATYELANNHLWRTEFAFRDWYTPAPSFIQPPFGGTGGGEREWIDFTLGMYYTLLNCGFRLPASAGTANGVHPVPAGFGRVYVHLPGGFDDRSWRRGLKAGRSFVTTGPMLFATADEKHPGHLFTSDTGAEIPLRIEVISERPVTFGEVLINGRPEHLLRVRSEKTETGAYRAVVEQTIEVHQSGWFAVRFFEDRDATRVRFAHTSPWYIEIDGGKVEPTWDERDYLISRMKNEIQRSRGVVSLAALEEYQHALDFYRELAVSDDAPRVPRNARPLSPADRQRWLENMIVDHRFTAGEVRSATGMSIDEAEKLVGQMRPIEFNQKADTLKILPYPGGRHPRRGFLDGAIDPQRETKISVFPPWRDGGYAVVDVPEAVFSNLGLTYLAHTHVPTVWTEQSVELEQLEWNPTPAGGFELRRTLPGGITIHSRVGIDLGAVTMKMSLTNGTDEILTGLRSQVCVMLKGLVGFNAQRRRDARVEGPLIAIKADRRPEGDNAEDGLPDRWIITAWQPNHRTWDNPPVPCIHSDPVFPDCPPGETVHVEGRLWFYEGHDIREELERLAKTFDSSSHTKR